MEIIQIQGARVACSLEKIIDEQKSTPKTEDDDIPPDMDDAEDMEKVPPIPHKLKKKDKTVEVGNDNKVETAEILSEAEALILQSLMARNAYDYGDEKKEDKHTPSIETSPDTAVTSVEDVAAAAATAQDKHARELMQRLTLNSDGIQKEVNSTEKSGGRLKKNQWGLVIDSKVLSE